MITEQAYNNYTLNPENFYFLYIDRVDSILSSTNSSLLNSLFQIKELRVKKIKYLEFLDAIKEEESTEEDMLNQVISDSDVYSIPIPLTGGLESLTNLLIEGFSLLQGIKTLEAIFLERGLLVGTGFKSFTINIEVAYPIEGGVNPSQFFLVFNFRA